MTRSFPSSGEDWSVIRWWRDHPRRGRLLVEVEIGGGGPGDWPNRRSSRRLDAVHLPGHVDKCVMEWAGNTDQLAAQTTGVDVEIVEAKDELNFDVIGQCLAGVDMFARAYPQAGLLTPFAVVRGSLDPALAWVCHRRGIRIATYDEGLIHDMRDRGDGTWLQP